MYLPDYTLVYALLAVHTFCTYPASSAFLLHSTYLNFDPLHFCTFNCTAITTIHDYTRLHFTRPAHILHEAALILHPPHSTCTQYALTLRSCLHFYLNLHLSCILRMLLALNMHSYCALACTFIHPLHSCTFNCTAITRLATLNSTCTYPAFSAFYLHSICTIVATCLHFDPLHFCTFNCTAITRNHTHACLHFTRPAHILHEAALILHPPHSTCTQYALMLRSCLHFYLNLHLSCILRMLLAVLSSIPCTPALSIALQLHAWVHFTRPALILHSLHFTCTQYALLLRPYLHFDPLHSCTFNFTVIARLATLHSTCTYPAFSAFYLHSICTIVAACLHFDPLHSCTLHACTQPALLSPLREVLNPLELLHSTYTHSTCTSLSSWLFDPLELPVLNLHSAYMHSTCTPLSLLLDPLELPVLNMHSSRGYT